MYFGTMNTDTRYKLFNIFCMNVYGNVLRDSLTNDNSLYFIGPYNYVATYQLTGNCMSDFSNAQSRVIHGRHLPEHRCDRRRIAVRVWCGTGLCGPLQAYHFGAVVLQHHWQRAH